MKETTLDIPAWLTVVVQHDDDATEDQIKRLAAKASSAIADDDDTMDVTPDLDFVTHARVYAREFDPRELDARTVFDLFEIVSTEDLEG